MSQYVCPECGYRYDEAVGDAHMGLLARGFCLPRLRHQL